MGRSQPVRVPGRRWRFGHRDTGEGGHRRQGGGSQLVKEIDKLREEATDAAKQQKAAADKVSKVARDVQDRIVAELREFDYSYFTKNRYSVPKVQEHLRKYKGEFPDSNAHAEALKRLGEGAPSPVSEVASPPTGVAGSLTGLAELLAETPTRVAIQALESKPTAQTWAEQGLALHEGLDHCLYCAGEIDNARRDQLARHFDESWLEIRSKAKTLLSAVTGEKQATSAARRPEGRRWPAATWSPVAPSRSRRRASSRSST